MMEALPSADLSGMPKFPQKSRAAFKKLPYKIILQFSSITRRQYPVA
jgi:hypothetical protein